MFLYILYLCFTAVYIYCVLRCRLLPENHQNKIGKTEVKSAEHLTERTKTENLELRNDKLNGESLILLKEQIFKTMHVSIYLLQCLCISSYDIYCFIEVLNRDYISII